ncbi:MAG: tetratricopeptide repeat protein, partial [Flavobacteriales bacterium]|nr:tetratricopeptide repeat protein [Flavobacteriales bacterium]
MKYSTIITLLIILCFSARAQDQFANKTYYLIDSLILENLTSSDRILVDSALALYHKAEHDTTRIISLDGICSNMMDDAWSGYQFYQYRLIQQALNSNDETSVQQFLKLSLANALGNMGVIYDIKGNKPLALEYYFRGLNVQENLVLTGQKQVELEQGIASILNNIGYIYDDQGKITEALLYYQRSLTMQEELSKSLDSTVARDGKIGVATSLNNIAVIYNLQEDLSHALAYFQRCVEIQKDIEDRKGLGLSLNNIGSIYDQWGEPFRALEYHLKSLAIREEIGYKQGIALSLNNIGAIYRTQGELAKSLDYFQQSLKIREEIGYKQGIALSLHSMAGVMAELGDLSQARLTYVKVLQLGREIGNPSIIADCTYNLSWLDKQQGNYENALKMYELHIQMRDSIKNEETQKATIRQQTKYEFEKAQLVKEQEEKEAARILAEETGRRDNLQHSVILIALLVLFGGVLPLGFVKV